ncbi:hypothetical protein TBLA_0B04170 [Henningerozyma blattae CBS 6284]|uniref:Pyridoxamine kinase/Phosphomethylpyrimidine kinase domain-containing protein n=1 Tax=Henningerozyma blattae (strain ATCC 34711 / CBS 6284 / DSM 70876 / NBRC 10599 / NRRL Y-10934 / UCD 77-7) TaxID=1071380 RepID=I2GYQ3_HENB6|nr:hypothetical protein TBLA_0B04170 [Tetrapisispora blattae CBS 6284]CCH59255.1 hypothetical protein TBLA_0B04170 [Tetrapisispora blattae CBS 6284]
MTQTVISINSPPPYLTLSGQEELPTVLTIGGSDSSGSAGIEADLKTITAHRCYSMTCLTAVTVQTPSKVYNIQKMSKDLVKEALDVNLRNIKCDVIKCGLLTIENVQILNKKLIELGDYRPKLIWDPFLNEMFVDDDFIQLVKAQLTPFAELITPNLQEALKLINKPQMSITSIEDIFNVAQEVSRETKCANILIKGGQLPYELLSDNKIIDILYLGNEEKFIVYNGNIEKTHNTHGAGCTLASSVASNLALGYSLAQAVYGGIEYVQNAISLGCTVIKVNSDFNGRINHVHSIEIPMEKMIKDECFNAHSILSARQSSWTRISNPVNYKNNFFDYLIHHPYVKRHWKTYTNHEFVNQIATATLDPKKFQFFIEQDYSYLVDYARVHCIAASKAPTLSDIELEIALIAGTKVEITAHKEKLTKYFGVVDDSYYDTIKRGPALNNYSRYFNDIAKRGTWEELVAALTPCLMGYCFAARTFEKNLVLNEDYPYYNKWCSDCLGELSVAAIKEGEKLLNHIASTYPPEKIETLVKIFGDVCQLETQFWDAALAYNG